MSQSIFIPPQIHLTCGLSELDSIQPTLRKIKFVTTYLDSDLYMVNWVG